MNTLQAEIVKLIGKDTFTTIEITDRLAHNGWEVRPEDVLDALHRLEVQRVVERLWQIKRQETRPDVAIKKAGVGH